MWLGAGSAAVNADTDVSESQTLGRWRAQMRGGLAVNM